MYLQSGVYSIFKKNFFLKSFNQDADPGNVLWLTLLVTINNCFYAKTCPCAKSNTASKVLLRSVDSVLSLLRINALRTQYLYIISSKEFPTPCIVTILSLALQKRHTTNIYTYNDISSYCLISNISSRFSAFWLTGGMSSEVQDKVNSL